MLKTVVVNLGCPKNEVDAERLVYLLDNSGFELVDDPAAARIIIVNTCAFIQPAVEEAIETILELARYKQDGDCQILAVSGCLPQRYGAELAAEIPEIDLLFGVADWCRIANILQQAADSDGIATRLHIGPPDYRDCQNLPQAVTPPGAYAYLKIAEGCDNRCSYCMIPAIKGRQQSVPREQLLAQARRLNAGGVRELNLVAQDITAYGRDLPAGNGDLCDLLDGLCRISGLARLRLLYAYPGRIDARLIEMMREREQICNYIDIPVQHIDNTILEKMGRRDREAEIRRVFDELRDRIPEIYIRSTVMVGFPGESEAAFRKLLDFIASGRIDYLGAFTFWPEPGSRAAEMPDQLPEELKKERLERVLETQRQVTEKRLRREVGRRHEVLVEGLSRESDLLLEGRTFFQAPEVDGTTYITEGETETGELVEVEIHDCHEFDLFARII